jgi:protein MpaA
MNFKELKSGVSIEGDAIPSFKTDIKSQKYIYLIGGVHGDEVEGVYVAQKIFEWLQETTEVELPMVVIPILNVDGYRTGSRTNSHGVDLNRNLDCDSWVAEFKQPQHNPGPSPMSEPENKYLDKLFQKFAPSLILSIHSWKPVINFNGDCEHLAQIISSENNYQVVGNIGYPPPGSLGDYAPAKYDCPVITFECPKIDDNLSLQDIWDENKEGFIKLLKSDEVRV